MLALSALTAADNYMRVCYYTNWAQYRPPPMKFFPEHLDPNLCTHIMYAFAKIGRGKDAAAWNANLLYSKV